MTLLLPLTRRSSRTLLPLPSHRPTLPPSDVGSRLSPAREAFWSRPIYSTSRFIRQIDQGRDLRWPIS